MSADRDADAPPAPMEIDPKLLESLVCPVTLGPLEYDREHHELVSRKARLAFPIRDAVPILLRSEAREIEDPGPPKLDGAVDGC